MDATYGVYVPAAKNTFKNRNSNGNHKANIVVIKMIIIVTTTVVNKNHSEFE